MWLIEEEVAHSWIGSNWNSLKYSSGCVEESEVVGSGLVVMEKMRVRVRIWSRSFKSRGWREVPRIIATKWSRSIRVEKEGDLRFKSGPRSRLSSCSFSLSFWGASKNDWQLDNNKSIIMPEQKWQLQSIDERLAPSPRLQLILLSRFYLELQLRRIVIIWGQFEPIFHNLYLKLIQTESLLVFMTSACAVHLRLIRAAQLNSS